MKRYICIVFIDFHHTKLYPFQNLSLEFILKVFLRFRKFQPRYSYKIYSYRKKRVYILDGCPRISASVEMDFRDFLLSREEVELTELVDVLFLFFPNSSVMNSAICRYGDLGYQKKLRTAPVSVFTKSLRRFCSFQFSGEDVLEL